MSDYTELVARLRESAELWAHEVRTRKEAVTAIEALQAENGRQKGVIASVNGRCDHIDMRLDEVLRERDALRARVAELEGVLREAMQQAVEYDGLRVTDIGPRHWYSMARNTVDRAQDGPQCECSPVRFWGCKACNHRDAERMARGHNT